MKNICCIHLSIHMNSVRTTPLSLYFFLAFIIKVGSVCVDSSIYREYSKIPLRDIIFYGIKHVVYMCVYNTLYITYV